MKMSLTILVVIVTIIVLSSCTKEDIIRIDAPALYHKAGLEKNGSIRLFANSGEIKTPAILNRFLPNDSNRLNDISDDLFPKTGFYDSIKILDSENAKIRNSNTYYDYSILADETIVRFTGKDTLAGSSSGEVFSRSISYNISLYKPFVFSEYPVSSTGGFYLFGYTTKSEFFLVEERNQLKAPWIGIIAHLSMGTDYSYLVPNEPDFNFYKSLAAGDTVLLQEYSVIYEK